MRVVWAGMIAALLAPSQQTVPKKTPSFEEMIRMRVVLTVPGMDAVKAHRDLVYKTADGQVLHMDVYAPPGPPQPRPGVILIHGGPIPRIGMKNIGVFVSYGELLSSRRAQMMESAATCASRSRRFAVSARTLEVRHRC